MRILQIVTTDASQYERKSQRIDLAVLSQEHEVAVAGLDQARSHPADVAHVYASRPLPARAFAGFPLPWVSSQPLAPARWTFRRPADPSVRISPLFTAAEGNQQLLPEAVEDCWFAGRSRETGTRETEGGAKTIASFRRPGVETLVEQTIARISRVREDVSWVLLDDPPSPADLAGVDLWADPALGESDFDGFVAEALVYGVPTLAARTPINESRLEHGRTGMLVRAFDSNEWSHAILTALFKPEVSEARVLAARQTASKFRSRQRARVLSRIYQTLIS